MVTVGDEASSAPQPTRVISLTEEVLRQRAESLALEQDESVDTNRIAVLLFRLAEEWYGVRIAEVRELYNEYTVTPIPCVPEYIMGVINIRGEIVSVTDPRSLLGFGSSELLEGDAQQPVIIVANGPVCTALVVDEIGDIIEIAADAVEPPVAAWDKSQSEYVAGAFYTGERLVALVNLSKVLAPVGGE